MHTPPEHDRELAPTRDGHLALPAERESGTDQDRAQVEYANVRQPGAGYETSFEHDLDDDPGQAPPVLVDGPANVQIKLPIIPAHLQTVAGVKASVKRAAGVTGYRAGYHGLRLPRYLTFGLFWAFVGVFRLAGRQIRWAWAPEEFTMLQHAANSKDLKEGRVLAQQVGQRRKARGLALLAEAVGLTIAVAVLVLLAPWWVKALAIAVAVPVFARIGRPRDRRIVSPAVVTPRHRKLTADIVLRAYYRAKLADPDKPGQQVTFASPMARDNLNAGSQVVVDLPYGTTFSEVMNRREKLASGLDVALSQVHLTPDKTSNRRHLLWVADVDPLGIPAGRTPLLDCKPRDIWAPAPLGLDERGRRVMLPLMWHSMLIGAQPRKGKALALDTPVPTPSGWTTMGELQDGDWVYDEMGQPCRVVQAHDVRYDRPCYQVTFSDGSEIVADADHLWRVDTRSSRLGAQQRSARTRKTGSPYSNDQSHKWALPKVVSTAEMVGSVRIQADRRANYSVRVAAPLQAEDAQLPVPPYTLGAWLGDGTSIFGTITCQDEEIIRRIEHDGEKLRLIPSTVGSGRCPGYRILGIQGRLREIGVLGNKHIPVSYLRASEEQRRALLAGLLDTDGYCQDTGVVYFAVTNERLARDVRHLVSTLGYKSTLNVKPVKFQGRDHGRQWVVTFTPSDAVFGMARKVARQVTSMKASAGHRFITEIRPVASVPVRCITVDSPSSLYLVGETCIPTHNTFTARALALFAALDPYARLSVFDGKGSPDWRKFALVAYTHGFGLLPDRVQGDPVQNLLSTLRAAKRDVLERNARLSELPTSVCPEGKLTREIARDRRYGMPVWVIMLDEFQEYLNTGDEEVDREIAELLVFLVKVGPSVGIILLSSTQKPSGIGSTGKVAKLFTDFRDQHLTRFALKTGSYQVSEAVLGSGSYSEGYDSSSLPVGDGTNGSYDYRGIGILYDSPVGNATVRTFLADGQDAEKILTAARGYRQRVGTLDGMAVGEAVAQQARDVLADSLDCFLAGEAALSWDQLAERLREQLPERYADATGDAISATLRNLKLGIESKNVRVGEKVLKGVQKTVLDRAMTRRENENSR